MIKVLSGRWILQKRANKMHSHCKPWLAADGLVPQDAKAWRERAVMMANRRPHGCMDCRACI